MIKLWPEYQLYVFVVDDQIKNNHMHHAVITMMDNDKTLFTYKGKTNIVRMINPRRIRIKTRRAKKIPIDMWIE